VINLLGGRGIQGELDMGTSFSQRLWLWAPILAGGVLSSLFLLGLALPQALEIGKVLHHLQELEEHRLELEQLTREGEMLQQRRLQTQAQSEQLIQLVTGRAGDLSTFLATLDIEARQAKVELELYEPQTAAVTETRGPGGRPATPPGNAPSPNGAEATGARGKPPGPDALGRAGLRERSLLLAATGTYPQLLEFLRRMERLEVLVEQKDLTLKVKEDKSGQPRRLPPSSPIVQMNLSLTLWSKEAPEGRRKTMAPAIPPPAPAQPG
jgi:type IV pilus assembly protein PilO